MNSHQIDIVRLAWARDLGLPDSSFRPASGLPADFRPASGLPADYRPASGLPAESRPASGLPADRTLLVDDTARRVRFVVLDGHAVLVGPSDVLERADGVPADVLVTRDGLADVVGPRRGRCSGPVVLAYLDDVRTDVGAHNPLLSHSRRDAERVLSTTPPDDAVAARAADATTWVTVFDDSAGEADAVPVSAAGYVEWQGFLADTVAVTVPSHRRRGYGKTSARLATNDAIDSGLIPQLRVAMDDAGARLFGRSLGFTELGVAIAMDLPAPG